MTIAAFVLEILKEGGTLLGVLIGLTAFMWSEFPETRPFWLKHILKYRGAYLVLLILGILYAALYHSAGAVPDILSLALIVLSGGLGAAGVLMRRRT